MNEAIKMYIGRYPVFKKSLILLYNVATRSIYFIYEVFNLSFSYLLLNKTRVKFKPKGQIAFRIFTGKFEQKELEIFQALLKPNSIMFDVGANIGLYSIIGSKLVGAKGKVYSFEPSKINFNRLQNNIEINKIKNVNTDNIGIGDKVDETLILSQNYETGDAEKYIINNDTHIKPVGKMQSGILSKEAVQLDTLDNFQLNNDIERVDFIKIDVEGYEYYVFRGAENILKNNHDIVILFECAEHLAKRAGSTQNEVFSFLNSLGLDIVYWNEKERKWSSNQEEAKGNGQLLAGRNIMDKLNQINSRS